MVRVHPHPQMLPSMLTGQAVTLSRWKYEFESRWEYKKYFKFICIFKIFLLYLYCKFIYYIENPRWVLL